MARICFILVLFATLLMAVYGKPTYGLSWSAFTYDMKEKDNVIVSEPDVTICTNCTSSCLGTSDTVVQLECQATACLLGCRERCSGITNPDIVSVIYMAKEKQGECLTKEHNKAQSSATRFEWVGLIIMLPFLVMN